MALSITTDYVQSTGDPSPYLRRIADAGFSHLHWCHQWNTDFLYSNWEVEQIQKWLTEFGLQLLDLHATAGREKNWGSRREYERLAGLELVRNRMTMAAQLNSDVIIMHAPHNSTPALFRRSLDDLMPFAREHGIRIAIENLANSTEEAEVILSEYSPDYLGLCYDAGHGNISGDGLDCLGRLKDRLISVHLHDNDGTGDQHNPLFSGTVDWPRLAEILADSAYTKCVSMEVTMPDSGIEDENVFLKHAFETGTRFSQMIEEHRQTTEQPDGAVTQESAQSAAP
jgi:sugar phosphate isomerase/epimerase